MLHDNPYNKLLDVIKSTSINNNSPSMQIGQIINPPPEIQISYNSIILDKNDIWISDYLLSGYRREAKGHLVSATQNRSGGGGYAEFASHNHDIDNDYTDDIAYTDTLKIGDFVAIMPMIDTDDNTTQTYIVLDRIVRADAFTRGGD